MLDHVRLIARFNAVNLLRQKKVWFSLLVTPLFSLPFLLVAPGLMAERQAELLSERDFTILVDRSLREEAKFLDKRGYTIEAIRSSLADDVATRRVDAAVKLNRPNKRTAGTLEVLYLNTRDRSKTAAASTYTDLMEFQQLALNDELKERDIKVSQLIATLEARDVAKTKAGSDAATSGAIPPFQLFQVAAAVGFAATLLTEEKERRTIEPLLVAHRRRDVIVGKWVAGMVVIVASVLLFIAVVGFMTALPPTLIGQQIAVSAASFVAILFGGIVLAGTFTALGLLVGSRARTQSESYAANGPIVLLVTGLAALLLFGQDTIGTSAGLGFVPLLGPIVFVRAVLTGEASPLLALGAISTVWTIPVLLELATRQLGRTTAIIRPA